MKLQIKGQNLFLAPVVIERIERRLLFALSRFTGRIDRVTVRLADLNGPRGGVDKQCRIVVKLRRAGEVVIEDTAADLEAAIDRGAARVQRAVARALAQMRATEDSPTLVPGGGPVTDGAAHVRLGDGMETKGMNTHETSGEYDA